jgi:hypothetical protein
MPSTAQAMPAHEAYNTLIDIWSRGCNPVLHYSLPILFSFELSSFILSALGIHRRCHYAIIRQEAEAHAQSERLEAALAFEKKKRAEEKAKTQQRPGSVTSGRKKDEDEIEMGGESEDESQTKEDEEDRKEIASLISDDQARLKKLQSFSFGPSFGFGLTAGNIGKEDDSNGAELGTRKTVA